MDPVILQETVKTDESTIKLESDIDLKKDLYLRINTTGNRAERMIFI